METTSLIGWREGPPPWGGARCWEGGELVISDGRFRKTGGRTNCKPRVVAGREGGSGIGGFAGRNQSGAIRNRAFADKGQ